MKIRRTLLPQQPGTKRWLEQYGKNLVCVRYRYDEKNSKKITTAEIIVKEQNWERNRRKIPLNKIMSLLVQYDEIEIRRLIKAAGGRWNSEAKVWELAYGDVVSLGLRDRIVVSFEK